ncbi:LuxR C-terminal-related transcriptional regulator [Streptomyces sparsogenes]|uniref:helix-turn-helix transcriptional regulator n=1 Tax=Streptomyces sparsogenes TaxID=67365 RepID=UPI0034027CF3
MRTHWGPPSPERRSDPPDRFRPLADPAAVRAWLAAAVRGCSQEILVSQPDAGRRIGPALWDGPGPTASLVGRGVVVRVIHRHTARFDNASRAGMGRVVQGGGEVRTLAESVPPLIIFDRETVLIPTGEEEAAVAIRHPGVAHFMVEAFARAWAVAVPFEDGLRATGASEAASRVRATILRLLAEGQTDAVIARRVGVSVRTCRNHIARIYQELGARSRFQLGVLVSRSGLLERLNDDLKDTPAGA